MFIGFVYIGLRGWHWTCIVKIQELWTICVALSSFQAIVLYGKFAYTSITNLTCYKSPTAKILLCYGLRR